MVLWWSESNNLKHPRPPSKKKKTKQWLFVTSTYLDVLSVSTNGKFCFWATECQSDSPQSSCHRESSHHPHNYSNWATAGDSSSFLLPIGLKNQNTGVALCLGCDSVAWRKQIWLSGIHGYSRIFLWCFFFFCLPQLQLLMLTNLQTQRSPHSSIISKKSEEVHFVSVDSIGIST